MKKSPRKTATLSAALHHRLNIYTLAATAAGAGFLALPRASEAKIVYKPAHRVIDLGDVYHLDLNHDGTTDFSLHNYNLNTGDATHNLLFAVPASRNGVEGHATSAGFPVASALRAGRRIGPKALFSGTIVADCLGGSYCLVHQWVNAGNRYLGLRFQIGGQVHYGWARLNVKLKGNAVIAVLAGYAYETAADKPIVAGQTKESDRTSPSPAEGSPVSGRPQPTTLGLLAIGASGRSIGLRKESLDPLR